MPTTPQLLMGPLRIASISAVLLALACGPSAAEVRPTSPFTEEDALYFEDGVDFVADPEALGGRWREEWSAELDQRVRRADLVAVVRVATVRTDIDLDRHSTYWLVAEVDRALVGEAPDDELSLSVREGQGGFGTVQGNDRRIMNQPFVAFVKWSRTEAGERVVHWHLAPASDPVVRRVEWLVENRRDVPARQEPRQRVIIHEH